MEQSIMPDTVQLATSKYNLSIPTKWKEYQQQH